MALHSYYQHERELDAFSTHQQDILISSYEKNHRHFLLLSKHIPFTSAGLVYYLITLTSDNLWIPLVAISPVPIVAYVLVRYIQIYHFKRFIIRSNAMCYHCGYDIRMTAASGQDACPECGSFVVAGDRAGERTPP